MKREGYGPPLKIFPGRQENRFSRGCRERAAAPVSVPAPVAEGARGEYI